MPLTAFLAQFGFTADPFESTNAEHEPRLGEYFVPPPYFPTVMGDTAVPQSQVVLAPRGGGKTAQRRMIEDNSAATGDFLCVTYDKFDQPAGFRLADVSLAYHINQICRLIVVGLLLKIDESPELVDRLSEHQKQLLKFQVKRFLGTLSADEFRSAIDRIKNFGDRAGEFLKKYGGPVAVAMNVLLKKLGLDAVELPAKLAEEASRDDSVRYHLEQLLQMARALGFRSTYVLVDRVDELDLTAADANSTLKFIQPLVNSLPTLEAPGVAFKFFLWDQIEGGYRAGGSRPDRVPVYTLRWRVDELETMLSQRLAAYSQQRVNSMNSLLCPEVPLDAHKLVAYLAAGSPRDMVRLSKRIVAEQTRTTESATCIEDPAIWAGIREFADERAHELFGPYLGELRRIDRPTFTINYLANDVFRISTQAARQKVQSWMATGIVAKISELPNRANRPLHLFGVVDLRVAIAVLPPSLVGQALTFAIQCPSCSQVCVTDRMDIDCPNCSKELKGGSNLLEICRASVVSPN
jgi:hypothetical protein